MKNYKKLSKLAPICVLSTSLLVGTGNVVFAAEQPVKNTVLPTDITMKQTPSSFVANPPTATLVLLNKDLQPAIQQALKNKPELFAVGHADPNSRIPVNKVTDPVTKDALDHYADYLNNYNNFGDDAAAIWDTTTFELTGVGDELKITSAPTSDSQPTQNVELLNYHNFGDLEQPYTTVAQQRSTTDSFTYSNSEGVKTGISSTTKVGIDIPFIPSDEGTIKITADFSYDHTSSNTTSTTKTITYPSQTVKCMPHGTTLFTGTISQVNFNGSYTGPFRVVEPTKADVIVLNAKHQNFIGLYPAAGEEGHFLYNAFKYSGQPLPSYLELDDATKSIIIKKPTSTITFTGQAGFSENATLKFTPDDTSKPSVTMPYAEYMAAQESGNLTKYVNDKINEEMKKNN
ncbi:ETX/MTX2 family pore-forming toxin [Bacillus cereus]|uniref:ETX/MTX2 family pore-forming toxin n=1 Tax=Bacillus cereus TaxID=1396 RepID=UPI000951D739|nr:ETX/MTX2 family pore-forming toxin [Bacillus cereus]OLR22479.1 hypothetical protein BLD50_28005 [Bacillus cereus]